MATDGGEAKSRSKVGLCRLLVLIGIATIACGLQIGLPVLTAIAVSDVKDETIHFDDGFGIDAIQRTHTRETFWSQRFQFTQFFDPHWSDVSNGQLISSLSKNR